MSMSIFNIAKGVVVSFLVTLILLFVFSIVLTYSNISENIIAPTIIVITGLMNGALIGGIYLMIIYIISSIINQEFSLTINSIIMIIASIICGMFGGVLGINKV